MLKLINVIVFRSKIEFQDGETGRGHSLSLSATFSMFFWKQSDHVFSRVYRFRRHGKTLTDDISQSLRTVSTYILK